MDCNIDLHSLFSINENGIWSCSIDQSGVFKVAYLRRKLDSILLRNNLGITTYWSNLIPGKIYLYGWKTQHRRLATFENLIKRGIISEQKPCPLCGTFQETEDHIFADFFMAKNILREIACWWKIGRASCRERVC